MKPKNTFAIDDIRFAIKRLCLLFPQKSAFSNVQKSINHDSDWIEYPPPCPENPSKNR